MADATAVVPYRDLAAYIERLFAREDEVLRELRAEIARRGMPEIYITPEEGKLLQVLLAAVGARRVLEIGALAGYSAIWMARALPPGGKLITLEIEPTYAELAREFARRAGLAGVIEVRLGVAMESLRQLVEERVAPFDACFIDADKAGYPAYLQWALRLVRPGGIILGDNVLWGGLVLEEPPRDDDTLALQVFNRRLATDPNLVSTIIPIRDGLAVAVIRPRAEEAEEGEAGGEEPAAAQEPTAA